MPPKKPSSPSNLMDQEAVKQHKKLAAGVPVNTGANSSGGVRQKP